MAISKGINNNLKKMIIKMKNRKFKKKMIKLIKSVNKKENKNIMLKNKKMKNF